MYFLYQGHSYKEDSEYLGSCVSTYALEEDLDQDLILLLIWFLLGYDIVKFC